MMCSFQLPEPWQPSRSWSMYKVPPPESCPDEVELLRRMATEQPERTEEAKAWLRGYAQVRYPPLLRKLRNSFLCVSFQAREESPVAVKHAGENIGPEGRRTFLYWMKAKTDKKFTSSLQKVVFLLYFRSKRLTSAIKVHNGLHFRPSLVRDIISMIRDTLENVMLSQHGPRHHLRRTQKKPRRQGTESHGHGSASLAQLLGGSFTNVAPSTSRAWIIAFCSMSEFVYFQATIC